MGIGRKPRPGDGEGTLHGDGLSPWVETLVSRQPAEPPDADLHPGVETNVPADGAVDAGTASQVQSAAALWRTLAPIALSAEAREDGRLISHDRSDPAHISFDMLRTRAAHALKVRGWSRIAVTSPTKGCGKTFVAANLALSLARARTLSVGLFDMDLRLPGLAKLLGVPDPGDLVDLLTGRVAIDGHMRTLGEGLAVALNDGSVRHPAELLQDPHTGQALSQLQAQLGLGVMIYDMPPMLACDDVLAFIGEVDCVLLVAGGGITRADEITRCEKLLEDRAPILGVVLNRAEDPDIGRYYY